MIEVITNPTNNLVLLVSAENERIREALPVIETKHVIASEPDGIREYNATWNGTVVGTFAPAQTLQQRTHRAWQFILQSAVEFEQSQIAQWEVSARLANTNTAMERVRITYFWRISLMAGGLHLLTAIENNRTESNVAALERYIADIALDVTTSTYIWYRDFARQDLWKLYLLDNSQIWTTNPNNLAPLVRVIPTHDFNRDLNHIQDIIKKVVPIA